MVEAALEKQGILSQWMSESYRSKRAYDITTNRVTISTIHSAKGLDFSMVFLLGLDHLTPRGWTRSRLQIWCMSASPAPAIGLSSPMCKKAN